MSMAIEPLRGLCVKQLLDLRVRISLHDGETADRLRGEEGAERIRDLVDVMLFVIADHPIPKLQDDRRSHTMAAVRKAMPRLRGE